MDMKEVNLRLGRRVISIIISLAMLVGIISTSQMVIPANAASASFEVGDLEYKILTENTVEVSKNLHKSKNIVIPRTVSALGKTYTVTQIGRMAFSEQGVDRGEVIIDNRLEIVIIPDTVTSIGDAAFENTSKLRNVSIPDSVTSIGREAFYFSGITSVTLSKNIKEIKTNTFCGCSNLTDITFPEGIEKIGEEAFSSCSGFTSITLPVSIREVDETAFAWCDNLTQIIAPYEADFILKDERVMTVSDYKIDSPHGIINLSGERTTSSLFAMNKIVYWDTIKVTVTPESGYKLESLQIIDNKSNETYLISNYQFIASESDFTIKATYSGQGANGAASTNSTGVTNNTGSGSNHNNGSGNTNGSGTAASSGTTTGASSNNSSGTTSGDATNGVNYSSEWVNGKWYNADGSQTYEPTMSWKSNSVGCWIEDTSGWYPVSQWQKVDGYWYYFNADGYMASSEWRDGYYLSGSGALDYEPTASWYKDSKGWYFMDTSGWYPYGQWQKINGSWYYFDGSGYMVTSRYIDGYWIGADGVCN